MAQIDDRARVLNQPDEPEPDEPDDDQDDEPDDVDDEDQDDQDEDGGDDEGTTPPARPQRDSGAALSAGLVLGFVLYSAVIQVVRGGKAQLAGWIKAKLTNQPYTPAKGKTS